MKAKWADQSAKAPDTKDAAEHIDRIVKTRSDRAKVHEKPLRANTANRKNCKSGNRTNAGKPSDRCRRCNSPSGRGCGLGVQKSDPKTFEEE